MKVLSYMPVDKSYTHFQSAIYIAKEIHICIKNHSCYSDGYLIVCIVFVDSHVCNYLLCAHMYVCIHKYQLNGGTLIHARRQMLYTLSVSHLHSKTDTYMFKESLLLFRWQLKSVYSICRQPCM